MKPLYALALIPLGLAIGIGAALHAKSAPAKAYKAEVLAMTDSPALKAVAAEFPAEVLHAQKFEVCRGMHVLNRRPTSDHEGFPAGHAAGLIERVAEREGIEIERRQVGEMGKLMVLATENVTCKEWAADFGVMLEAQRQASEIRLNAIRAEVYGESGRYFDVGDWAID